MILNDGKNNAELIENNLVLVKLNKGFICKIDYHIWPIIKDYLWFVVKNKKYTHYAKAGVYDYETKKTKSINMARLILNILDKPNLLADHINHDGLNNCLNNLRVVTHAENARNARTFRGKSVYKGVCKVDTDSWKASIRCNGKNYTIGQYPTEEDAASAYNIAAKEKFGEFAYLNKIDKLVPEKRKKNSKYLGVRRHKNKWHARICNNKVRITLGHFEKEEDAACAYNEAAIKLGRKRLNKIK